MTSLYEELDPPNPQHSLENIYTTGRIRTRIANNQAAPDLRLRPCAHGIGDCGEMNIAIERWKATYVHINTESYHTYVL